MNTEPKRRVVSVTDPVLIASIERNQMQDVIGGKDERGNYWAYSYSVERFKENQRAA